MKFKVFGSLFFFLLLQFLTSQAQQPIVCGGDIAHQQKLKDYRYSRMTKSIDRWIYEKALAIGTNARTAQVLTIPVVVHVIHNGGPENLSDAQIIQGIQFMNEGMANAGYYNNTIGTACDIQFCLALQDTNGNATSGIEHISSSLTNMTLETEDLQLKGLSHWDPEHYLNIYVVNSITSLSSGPGVAGYAFFPTSHGQPEDGIVGEYTYFGSSAGFTSVFIHEAGHYLGLYHTFQGGCANNDCMLQGDMICDTPPDQSTAPVPCTSTVNTCNTDDDDLSNNNPFRPTSLGGLGDVNDLTIDFMDYNSPNCMTVFTPNQSTRMRDVIQAVRASLLQSIGCYNPCNNPVTAAFTSSSNNIFVGSSVNFTNGSTGSNYSSTWKINGSPFSTSNNSSYQFNTAGNYIITLLIQSTVSAQCLDSISDTITVNCTAQALFTASDTLLNPGDTIVFTSNAINATSISWLLNGVVVSNSNIYTTTLSNLGGYNFQLVATNSTCSDTSAILYVQVGTSSSNEAANWYFGNQAGLHFGAGGPTAVLNNGISGWVQEGTACASDANGNILFYTDGRVVINRNHVTMANGSGLFGSTQSSSTQAALIVKQPGSQNIYYLFTNAEEADTAGLRYSIVDMSLNGGDGAVTQKNILLSTPMTEKLTATRHCNGVDVWVLAHGMGNNTFHAYLVTASGINPPVLTNIGTNYNFNFIPNNEANSRGYLRASINGNKLVACILGKNKFDLFDFNNVTGVVSNWVSSPTDIFLCYGAAFSSNDTKLYVSGGTQTTTTRYIYQYDLLAPTNTAIMQSKKQVGALPGYSAIALAPDGKIYNANYLAPSYTNLGVINNPNGDSATCNFQLTGPNLGGKTSGAGLPNFMCNYFYIPPFNLSGPSNICANSAATYIIQKPANFPYTFSWYASHGATLQILNDSTAVITFQQANSDTIIITKNGPCGNDRDTILVNTKGSQVNLGNDTIICNFSSITLQPNSTYSNYLWDDGSGLPQLTTNLAGWHWLEATDSIGCTVRDSLFVDNVSVPILDLGSNLQVCDNSIHLIDAGPGFTQYQWQDGFNQQIYTAYSAGTYWVTVTDTCGIQHSDSVSLNSYQPFTFSLGNDTTICDTVSLFLQGPAGYTSYLWNSGNTTSSEQVTSSGDYSLTIFDAAGCNFTDSARITMNICLEENFHFIVYPNPNFGEPVVDISQSSDIGLIRFNVTDVLGQIVYSNEMFVQNKKLLFTLPLSVLAQATYFLRIETTDQLHTIKLNIIR